MRKVVYPNHRLNRMSQEEIYEWQQYKLLNQIEYAYNNSSYYKRKFKEIGVSPEEIKSIEDFLKLPILMDKEAERLSQRESLERYGHPFGMHLCTSTDKLVLTATTSGTTGTPTFTYTYTQHDLNNKNRTIAYMLQYVGVKPGDRVLFNHALGVYATTAILHGIREARALPIDVDVRAGSSSILKYAELTKPSIAMMTPSLAEYLIEKTREVLQMEVSDLNLSALLTVGEIAVGIPEVKQKLEDAYQCRVYDYMGPLGDTLAFSCDSDTYYGLHCVTPDLNLYPNDLVDPETKKPIEMKDGAIGEIVYTSLDRLAVPMLRFASGDIVQVFTKKCPGCGFEGPRFKVIGRADDMLVIKGANVYPTAIKRALATFVPDITGEMRVVLDQKPPRVEPPLKLKVEYGENTTIDHLVYLEEKIKNKLKQELRFTPKIIWEKPATLEKRLTKTPLIEMNS